MNLTIHLQEERVDKATGKLCGGLSTFEDIRSLKLEYCPSNTGYKVELILFLGDKYNKQLVTIDNVERVVACGIIGLIHHVAYKRDNTITSKDTDTENLPKPIYEHKESYMEPTNLGVDILANKYREIKHAAINILNKIDKVEINVLYKVLDSSNGAKSEYEKEVKFIDSGDFKFGKLKQIDENNPGSEYGEIWRELPKDKYRAFMSILNAANKWKGDIEAIKHNTKISCDKIWKVELDKDEQLMNAVEDAEPDNNRYIMKLYGGLNGHGDWESYLDGLRTYIKCIKRMPNVDSVDVLEAQSDLPDDLFSVVIVVRFDNKKKKKDVNEEIDYRELI